MMGADGDALDTQRGRVAAPVAVASRAIDPKGASADNLALMSKRRKVTPSAKRHGRVKYSTR